MAKRPKRESPTEVEALAALEEGREHKSTTHLLHYQAVKKAFTPEDLKKMEWGKKFTCGGLTIWAVRIGQRTGYACEGTLREVKDFHEAFMRG